MNSYFYIFKSYYQDSFKSKKSNLLGYKIILFGKENLVLKNKETLLNSLLKNLKCTRNEKERQQSNKMFIWFLCSFPSTQLYICTINNKKYFFTYICVLPFISRTRECWKFSLGRHHLLCGAVDRWPALRDFSGIRRWWLGGFRGTAAILCSFGSRPRHDRVKHWSSHLEKLIFCNHRYTNSIEI